MFKRLCSILLFLIAAMLAGTGGTAKADVTAPAQLWDAQNLTFSSAGSTSSTGTVAGNYSVGSQGFFVRPIIPFAVTDFAPVTGQTITSATLSLTIRSETLEGADLPVSSEVRLFTTTIANLPSGSSAEGTAIGALTGDGGAHTAVGTLSFANGASGTVTLNFNAAGLSALETAINGSDPTIGIALREFSPQGDPVDVVSFRSGSSSLRPMLRVTAVPIPEPTSVALLGVGSLVLLRRRRRVNRASFVAPH